MKTGMFKSAALLLAVASAAALAEGPLDGASMQRPHGEWHRHTPPAEAFAACTGKAAGDKVTVTHGDRSVVAVCETRDGQLVARPERMRHVSHDPMGSADQ